MQAKEFIQLMQQNRQSTLDLLPELDALTAEFPWFSIAYQLKLKVLKEFDEELFANQLPLVAAHTANRGQLYSYLNNKIQLEVGDTENEVFYYQPDEVNIPTDEAEVLLVEVDKKNVVTETSSEIIDFTLDEETLLVDVEEEYSYVNRHEELLEKFIAANPRIIPREEDEVATNIKLADTTQGIASEELAKIYIQQKLYDKAIAVYKDLSLQNPKKRVYFATLIKKVKEIQ